MAKRILLAGLLGGIAMFIWAFVAHMVLPWGPRESVKYRTKRWC